MRISLSILLITYLAITCFSQECIKDFNFFQFSKEGTPEGDWEISDSNNAIIRSWVLPPTFLISPQSMINVRIKGTISVESTTDIDCSGIVFGYHKPTVLNENNTYNFYLFDWRAETEDFEGTRAYEGFRLSHYNGYIRREDIRKYFWGNVDNPPVRDLIKYKYGEGLGWEPHTKYQLELIYTSNRIRIKIDDVIIFEIDGCFNAGKFGLYGMSQYGNRFENFTYQNILDFNPVPASICIDESVMFRSFDFNCSEFPDFVESITWDFGDGHSGNEINPYHKYSSEGVFPVQLIMKTVDGCSDTIIKDFTVKPRPEVDIGPDILVSACSDLIFDAGNPGSIYLWSTGHNTQTLNIHNISQDTTIWVLVENNGCFNSDTSVITVEPIQEMLYFPNAFTPNGDGINDKLIAIGNTENIFTYQLLIFDRWGKLIFETGNPQIGWDGTHNGEKLPTAVYILKVNFRMESSCISGQNYSQIGAISLLR